MRLSFYVLIISFLAGVCWRSLFDIGIAGVGAFLVASLAVCALAQVERFSHTLYIALALFACLCGVVRTEFAERGYESARVYADGTSFVGEGVVVAEPDVRDGHTVLWLELLQPDGRYEKPVHVRVKVPPYPYFAYGDRVEAKGTLVIPRAFMTDTGRTFDYAGYLMKDGVHYELRDAVVKRTGGGEGNPLIDTLLALKHRWLDAVSRLLPEPEASLAGGVIVGAKRALGDEWLEMFRMTGIIHIVVLSGYNLTLVANSIISMTGRLPRLVGFGLGAFGVVCFALMTGGGATVARASVMALLGMLATHIARPYVIVRALALAAFLMVLWNPFVLVFDTGFQLSFVATLGLVLGSPLLAPYFAWLPSAFAFRDIVVATLATQLAVLPLLLYQIGQVSLVAPIVNVLVLPVVSFAMLTGFCAGLFGMLASGLGIPFAWTAHFLLSYIFIVVDLFARVPYASLSLPPTPWWALLGMYLLLVVFVAHKHNTTRAESSGM
ncbi:MAG: ComEC/Rec2 family competence protein [Candidatus Pacebacteria bacterium]|nr:ComEC/Rec2 family competence protein [Candidatus Paceibacterota bacterium]